jgi:hypothetical protein
MYAAQLNKLEANFDAFRIHAETEHRELHAASLKCHEEKAVLASKIAVLEDRMVRVEKLRND